MTHPPWAEMADSVPDTTPLPPYNENAAKAAAATRLARRTRLLERAPGIERALRRYRELDQADAAEVLLRTTFIRTSRGERPAPKAYVRETDHATRPPMTRLVGKRSHALRLYLTLVFVAQLETAAGAPYLNDRPNTMVDGQGRYPWVELAGLWRSPDGATPRAHTRRRRRMIDGALDTLSANGLVVLAGVKGQSGRYANFRVQNEAATDSGGQYTVPSQKTRNNAAIRLPINFFLNGWHLVLSDLELVTLLAIIDRTGELRHVERSGEVKDLGVDLKESIRWRIYGLSDEAYSTVHTLHAIGLIDLVDPMPNRAYPGGGFTTFEADADGHLQAIDHDENPRIPFRLSYPKKGAIDVFDRPALQTVLEE